VNDEQFQQWLDQHGGEVGRKNNEKQIDTGKLDPSTGDPVKTTSIDSTTITAKDGAAITLRRHPGPINNGQDYEIVEQNGPKATTTPVAKQAKDISYEPDGTKVTTWDDGSITREAPTTAGKRTAREEAEIAANAALPLDQDPRAETNAERAKRAQDTYHQQDTTPVSAEYVGKGKDRKKVTTYQSGRTLTEDAATNATVTGVSYDTDGTKVTTYDDGTETRESPAPGSDVAEEVKGADGKTYIKHTVKGTGTTPGKIYYTDQSGKEATLPDDTKGQLQIIPEGAPKFTPDYTQDDMGLSAYNQQLMQAARAGIITKEQGAQLIAQAGDIATRSANHGSTLRNEQATADQRANEQANKGVDQQITQRGQDINETASRRTAANTTFDNALNQVISVARYGGKGVGPVAAQALREALGMAQQNADRWGGLKETPRVDPVMQAARTAKIHPDGTVEVSVPHDTTAAAPTSELAQPGDPGGAGAGPQIFGPTPGEGEMHSNLAPPAPAFRPDPNDERTDGATPLPDSGQADAYTQAVTPQWDPTGVVASLQAQGYPDDVIQEALAGHLSDRAA
jgi:hypothetical protein